MVITMHPGSYRQIPIGGFAFWRINGVTECVGVKQDRIENAHLIPKAKISPLTTKLNGRLIHFKIKGAQKCWGYFERVDS